MTYGAVALARLGVRARALVGADEQAASAHELDFLRREGVDVRIVRLRSGPVFDNQRLPGGGRVQYAHGASDPLPADALPADWASADAVVLSPVAGEIGDDWAVALAPELIVALGWQGLLRRLRAGQRIEPLPLQPRPLIARADLNVVSVEDAVAGGQPVAELLPRAGQQLVVTNGPRPAVHLVRRGDMPTAGRPGRLVARVLPVRPAARPTDETGAGDVLLAGWAAAAAARRWAESAPGQAELAVAVTAASLHVEREGIGGVPNLRAICDRLLRPPG